MNFYYQLQFLLIIFLFLLSNETKEADDDMNISQEILVLDFGDEKREFFKAEPSTDFAKGKLFVSEACFWDFLTFA